MKIILKTFILLLLSVSNFLLADQSVPLPAAAEFNNGGAGGVGPGGKPENSINMYLIWLGIMGVVTIYYIVKKNKKQLA